jgi:hypothetical protein
VANKLFRKTFCLGMHWGARGVGRVRWWCGAAGEEGGGVAPGLGRVIGTDYKGSHWESQCTVY